MKNNKGFSLVELIVVIAIMAILAAVAVVGVSVYIPKAQKAADEQLVSDIEYALNLAMYNNQFENTPAGVLVIGKNEITWNGQHIQAGSEMDIVLADAFGANYKKDLRLQYENWTAASHLNNLDSSTATKIKNSSYLSGLRSDILLSDVEKFTSMANNLSGVQDANSLAGIYGADLLNKTAAKYGINVPADMNDEQWDAWGAEHPQEFSNLLVLAAAYDIDSQNDGTATGDPSLATTLIIDFSKYYAFASTSPEFSKVLTKYLDAMNKGEVANDAGSFTEDGAYTVIEGQNVYVVTTPSRGATWINQLEAEANKEKYKNKAGQTYAQYTNDTVDSVNDMTQAEIDAGSFMSILAAVNSTPVKDVAGDIGNSNLFTEGAVKGQYDQYMSAVGALSGTSNITLSVNDGEIAIIYDQNSMSITNTID